MSYGKSKLSNEYDQQKVEFRRRWNEHPGPLVDNASLATCGRPTLSTTVHDAEYWRKRAEEAHRQAKQMSNAEDERLLLDIARAYERLIELAVDRKIVEG